MVGKQVSRSHPVDKKLPLEASQRPQRQFQVSTVVYVPLFDQAGDQFSLFGNYPQVDDSRHFGVQLHFGLVFAQLVDVGERNIAAVNLFVR